MRAFDDFNHYTSLDDMFARTGALTWTPVVATDTACKLFTDYPRFTGSGQYLGIIGPGLFGFGLIRGVTAGFNVTLSRVIVGMAFMHSSHAEQGELSGMYGDFEIAFMDNSDGTHNFYQGAVGISTYSGTVGVFDYNGYPIFETPSGVAAMNAWNYVEVDATIGHAGIIHVRLNGEDILTVPGDFGSHVTGATSTSNSVRLRTENGWWWTLIDDFYYA